MSAASGVALPTVHANRQRCGDFDTLADALDYAADAGTGLNFHDGKGQLSTSLTYAQLRIDARAMAQHLLGLQLQRGDRVALIAETHPGFITAFFACQYAGLIPVPLPVTVHLGGREAFVSVLSRLSQGCKARVCLGSDEYLEFIHQAEIPTAIYKGTYTQLTTVDPSRAALNAAKPGEVAYVQFTSGSTRQPRGAVITQTAVLRNIEGMLKHGVELNPDDRFCSWLPLYHDMGLVGMLLAAMGGQVTVDLLDSRVFAMRPRLWPAIITRNLCTLSYSPPFGYELCARRLRPGEASQYRLGQWRVAGVGAEMVRADVLRRFAEAFVDAGFRSSAFLPCYGMAEVGLGISFSKVGHTFITDTVDRDRCADSGEAEPAKDGVSSREFMGCGRPMPGYTVEIRDQQGRLLPERRVGEVFVKGPSIMSGYLDEPEASAAVLQGGWLDTGDLGYRIADELVITGRRKDLIIINGRNIWPQDLEHIAEGCGVRTASAAAFSITDDDAEKMVLVIEHRSADAAAEATMLRRIGGSIRAEFGVDCQIVTVQQRTLPRTSSGKLSRTRAKQMLLSGELHQLNQEPAAAGDASAVGSG